MALLSFFFKSRSIESPGHYSESKLLIIFSEGETQSLKSSHKGGGGVAGGSCLDIFSLVYLFCFLSPSLGDGPVWSEILSQRAVKPKTTNQPNPVVDGMTSVCSCYHIYSKVTDKMCVVVYIDSYLTTHFTILGSVSRHFVV